MPRGGGVGWEGYFYFFQGVTYERGEGARGERVDHLLVRDRDPKVRDQREESGCRVASGGGSSRVKTKRELTGVARVT
jgi:hypothetical protein